MKEKIAIILGSESDLSQVKDGLSLLEESKIPYALAIISAHRAPDKLRNYCKKLEDQKFEVIIGCAGMAAALPGFVASYTTIPVIGVPLKGGMLDGLDALFSIAQTPKGIGLVSTGVGKHGFINAVIFALRILASSHKEYSSKLKAIRKQFQK